MIIKCEYCGLKNKSGAELCHSCGAPVSDAEGWENSRWWGDDWIFYSASTGVAKAQFSDEDETQRAHMRHWWRMSKIAENARGKLTDLFDTFGKVLARFLDGKK